MQYILSQPPIGPGNTPAEQQLTSFLATSGNIDTDHHAVQVTMIERHVASNTHKLFVGYVLDEKKVILLKIIIKITPDDKVEIGITANIPVFYFLAQFEYFPTLAYQDVYTQLALPVALDTFSTTVTTITQSLS